MLLQGSIPFSLFAYALLRILRKAYGVFLTKSERKCSCKHHMARNADGRQEGTKKTGFRSQTESCNRQEEIRKENSLGV